LRSISVQTALKPTASLIQRREEVRRLMDRYLAHEAEIPGAPTPKKLAHLAHGQNQQLGGLSFPAFEPGANGFTER